MLINRITELQNNRGTDPGFMLLGVVKQVNKSLSMAPYEDS